MRGDKVVRLINLLKESLLRSGCWRSRSEGSGMIAMSRLAALVVFSASLTAAHQASSHRWALRQRRDTLAG